MLRTVSILIVGVGSLAAFVMIATLLASSLGSPTLAGYEFSHFLGVTTLLLTLAAIILAWARFVERSRRHSS